MSYDVEQNADFSSYPLQ